ncbi:MAG: cysteine desulfurase family protein [Methyloligellaceae bacterium]
MTQIYLDYNASTPLAPEVKSLMRELMDTAFGNPSSLHWAGRPAQQYIEKARAQIAALLECRPEEIVFTSGGSEANNMVLKGTYYRFGDNHPHFITTTVEHPAIIAPCRSLEKLGAEITYLPVDGFGQVDPDDLEKAISGNTVLISIMHANNEVGTLQPISACAAIAREHGIPFHTDAAQSVGKIDTRVDQLGVDYLTIAGHKLYAPKGIGALYIKGNQTLEPLIHGAAHELGRRAGTESVLLNAALGEASDRALGQPEMGRIEKLRDRFWHLLRDQFGNRVVLNGHPELRLPNTLNVSFVEKVGAEILQGLDGVAASTGSACHSGQVELSPVLKAMGIPPHEGMGAIRFSLGRETTNEEIDNVITQLARVAAS